jgi:hypothetical protein
MSTKSRLIVAAAIGVLGLVSPASAQSFNRPEGTGNELPSYYDSQGGLHAGVAPQQIQIAAHRSGLNAFASVPQDVARGKRQSSGDGWRQHRLH